MFFDIIREIFALAVVLGLIGLLAYGLRRFAPELMARFQGQRAERRLKIVETLVLDPARRLVLVRIDAEERLILLGEGRLLSTSDASHASTPVLSKTKEPAS